MSDTSAFSPEVLTAFRRTLFNRVRYWDAWDELERLVGHEVHAEAFDLASGFSRPGEAFLCDDGTLADALKGHLGAKQEPPSSPPDEQP
jgi:hypothetical protein